jgi:hypothetical protein
MSRSSPPHCPPGVGNFRAGDCLTPRHRLRVGERGPCTSTLGISGPCTNSPLTPREGSIWNSVVLCGVVIDRGRGVKCSHAVALLGPRTDVGRSGGVPAAFGGPLIEPRIASDGLLSNLLGDVKEARIGLQTVRGRGSGQTVGCRARPARRQPDALHRGPGFAPPSVSTSYAMNSGSTGEQAPHTTPAAGVTGKDSPERGA